MTAGNLPNLLVIGAGKAGTTSLHHYLSLHPEIFMSEIKEICFFVPREQHGRMHLGVDWYRAQFPVDAPIRGETSPLYTVDPKIADVPERIAELLGAPKMIYILRDPVDRLLSHYVQTVEQFYVRETIPEMMPRIRERECYQYSCYYHQLSRFLEVFPKENILIIFNERLNANPRAVLREVFEFLGVSPSFWSPEFESRHNTRKHTKYIAPWFDRYAPEFLKNQLRNPVLRSRAWRLYRLLHGFARIGGKPIHIPQLSKGVEQQLEDLFRDDVASLRDFLGDPIPEWRDYAGGKVMPAPNTGAQKIFAA